MRVCWSGALERSTERKALIFLHFHLPSIITFPPSQFCTGKVYVFLWVFHEEWKNESGAWLSVYITRWGTPELLSNFIVWWF